MNPKRLALAIVAVFAGIWITDFLIHGVWLKNDYVATMSLWRPEEEMKSHMGWLMLGQFLATVTFVVIYAAGFGERRCFKAALSFGLLMALFSQAGTLINYAVMPLPGNIAVKWFGAAVAQGLLLGLIVFFVYKPKPGQTASPE